MIESYEAAIRLMQEGKFEKALPAFEKLLNSGAGDLADRVRMYISACSAQTSKNKAAFANAEERYDYAVSLLNHGDFEDARQEFESILQEDPNADYAHYGLALLSSMTGEVLAFVRGQSRLLVRKVHLNRFADELREQLGRELESQGVRLEIDARYTGVEGEGAYHFDFGLTLFANGALTSAKQLANAANPAAGIAGNTAQTLTNAPKWTDAVGAIYRSGPYAASVSYKQSGAFVAAYNNQATPGVNQALNLPGYDTVDASVSYDFGRFAMKLQSDGSFGRVEAIHAAIQQTVGEEAMRYVRAL